MSEGATVSGHLSDSPEVSGDPAWYLLPTHGPACLHAASHSVTYGAGGRCKSLPQAASGSVGISLAQGTR